MVTGFYAAILALGFVALAVHIIRGRRQHKVALGDGANFDMVRRIRAQANFFEYSVFFILLLLLAEMQGLDSLALHGVGALFLLGRVLHGYSVLRHEQYDGATLRSNPIWRIRGMMISFAVLTVLAVMVLVQSVWAMLG